MPELVTSVAAMRQGALTLAVGGIIGGNTFDVMVVSLADVAYREGSIYHAITERQIFFMALTLVLNGLLLLDLLRREKSGVANIGFFGRDGHAGDGARAVVWAHNSHLGDAAATQMGRRGEVNLGHLCRRWFGDGVYLIGFGTHTGTVFAASTWGAEGEVMQVRPSHPESYERLGHQSGTKNFFLPLRHGTDRLRHELGQARLERAIGVIYRPETELQSHYFAAVLPKQFDEWIWLDETHALTPLGPAHAPELPRPHPFRLLSD